MDQIRVLFDYQRFSKNPRLQRQIDSVCRRYLSQEEALADDLLDVVAAAGEPWVKDTKEPPGAGERTW